MDWKSFFMESCNNENIKFFNPISKEEAMHLQNEIGVTLSGDLLKVLQEANGIRDEQDVCVLSSNEMIKRYNEHIDYLKIIQEEEYTKILFFADDGCGNGFGYKFNNEGAIEAEEVGIYYQMENRFIVVAPDFKTWFKEWYSGRLAV